MAFYTVVASSDSDEAIQLPIAVIPGRAQARTRNPSRYHDRGALEPLTGSTPDRFCGLREDRGCSLGRDRQEFGRRAAMTQTQ
jgi:hypothetical protein